MIILVPITRPSNTVCSLDNSTNSACLTNTWKLETPWRNKDRELLTPRRDQSFQLQSHMLPSNSQVVIETRNLELFIDTQLICVRIEN